MLGLYFAAGDTNPSARPTPAGATPGNTAVSCTLDPGDALHDPTIHCVITDPDGIRTSRVNYGGGLVDAFPFFDCSDPSTTFDYGFGPPATVRIAVTDCEHPRSHAYYVVHADATVREIRNF